MTSARLLPNIQAMSQPTATHDRSPVIAGAAAAPPLILASASRSRARVLAQAGIAFRVQAGTVDEGEVKASLRAEGASVARVAETLAASKAASVARGVARDNGSALVIGADQILDCDGAWFDKPADTKQARAHLRALRGRTHDLVTSVCVHQGDAPIWRHTETARLTMRSFSDDFIDRYLEAVGDQALLSVGAYQLEGLGAQLFERVEGDFFTILGLPLLPLLAFLRGHGVVTA
jgi:septum formation protein